MPTQSEFEATDLEQKSQRDQQTSANRTDILNWWIGCVLCAVTIVAMLGWLYINSHEITQQWDEIVTWWNTPVSGGELITGRTWKEEKARRETGGNPKFGPFDEALWPESENDPLAIEPSWPKLPPPDFVSDDWKRATESLKRKTDKSFEQFDK